ncbi:hypothetical protein [Paraburkholderia bengalensis]|uniref:hypothetical protein n=1 Tax=Paraburkholderia bengalensis TaxID=2747562 RepID=UPI003AF5CFC3
MTAPCRACRRVTILGRQFAFCRRRFSRLAVLPKAFNTLAFTPCLCAPFDIFRRQAMLDHQFPDLVQRALRAFGDECLGLRLKFLYTCLDVFQCSHYFLPLNQIRGLCHGIA